jgi:hypothetical protein
LLRNPACLVSVAREGVTAGTLARCLRPPRLQRVLLDGLRHLARAAFINTPAREQRLVVLQHEHIPARANLRVVAQLAGLHAAGDRIAQPPDFLAGLPLTRNPDAVMPWRIPRNFVVGTWSAIAFDSTGRQ